MIVIHDDDDDDQENLINIAQLEVDLGDKPQKSSVTVLDWNFRKQQWKEYYHQKSDDDFVEEIQITRTTFNLLLNTLQDKLDLTPTKFLPQLTSPDI